MKLVYFKFDNKCIKLVGNIISRFIIGKILAGSEYIR